MRPQRARPQRQRRRALPAGPTPRRSAWRRAGAAPRRRGGRGPLARRLGRVGVGALLFAVGFAAGLGLQARLLRALDEQRPQALALRRVAVVGAARLAPAEVAAAAEIPAGATLPQLDAAGLAARVGAHPWVAHARVLALPPATLVIGVREREAVAVARGGPEGPASLVDRAGTPFAVAGPEHRTRLPQLVAAGSLELGRPDPALRAGLRIVHALAARDLPAPEQIVLAGEPDELHPMLRLRGLSAPVVLGPGELENKLARLARLLAGELAVTAEAKRIDLRFSERAILRVPPSRTGTAQRRTGARAPLRPTRDPSG